MFVRSGFKVSPVSQLNPAASLYLDFLRLLFSQLVLIGHAASFFGVLPFLGPPYFPWVQSIAVVGFFWLSGFLICHSVLLKMNDGNYSFRHYFIDRFSRIYTALIPSLLFVLGVDFAFVTFMPNEYPFYDSFSVTVAIQNLLMLQKFPVDMLYAPMFGSASTWWTLGVEWWLYMFFGWLLLSSLINSYSKIYILVLVLLSIVPVNYLISGNGSVGTGLALIWFVSCFFALIKDWACVTIRSEGLAILAISFLVLSFFRYKISNDAYDILGAIYLGLCFVFSVFYFQVKQFSYPAIYREVVVFFADYSFTLFLTHYSILSLISAIELPSGWFSFYLSLIVSNVLAAMIAYNTERRHRVLASFLKRLIGRSGLLR